MYLSSRSLSSNYKHNNCGYHHWYTNTKANQAIWPHGPKALPHATEMSILTQEVKQVSASELVPLSEPSGCEYHLDQSRYSNLTASTWHPLQIQKSCCTPHYQTSIALKCKNNASTATKYSDVVKAKLFVRSIKEKSSPKLEVMWYHNYDTWYSLLVFVHMWLLTSLNVKPK